MSNRTLTRRDALKRGGAAIAVPFLISRRAFGAADQVAVAVIGLGGRAGGMMRECHGITNMKVVAVADCFAPRVPAFIDTYGKDQGWKGYEDFRTMIEKHKPDGVMIETTTHARAWIAAVAFQMGCDAYIEKPMSLTIAEGRYMVEAARKYKRVTQVGTQQRSIELNNRASDMVKGGALGRVHTVLAPNFVGPTRWTDQPQAPMPEGARGDWWEVWTSQAVLRPYHPQIQYGWSRWWDYDGGGECFGVTGWGTHSYDQINRALGTDETGPSEIWLEEPVRVAKTGTFATPRGKEDTGADYHAMAQSVIGPRARVTIAFASGVEVKLHLDGDEGPGLGAIFIGEKGSIEINRNMIASDPKELTKGMESALPGEGRGTEYHVRNWLQCIESRKRSTADIEFGQRSTTLCYLVNIVREIGRVGEKLRWDPVHERFTNCDEANRLLSRERRKGWELPAIA